MSGTITLPREVVEDVLYALVSEQSQGGDDCYADSITVLRTALAAEQPSEDIEAMRRDAERYKWLRTRACHGPHERFVSEYGWFDVSGQHEPGFDAAIDAAMKEGKT